MKIIKADYIYIDGEYKRDYAIAFDKRIERVGRFDEIDREYPDVERIICEPNTILYAGFINTHTHLEFSANRTKLNYGSFIGWLISVINHRDELMNGCDIEMIDGAIDEMLRSGVTTFGAISSLGLDLEASIKAPQRVLFFNELIGSNPESVDILYQDFMQRFKSSALNRSSKFIPAVAIHAPYSVHPIVIKKALSFVKDNNLPLTAHLLESQAEREWLDNSTGEFSDFFAKLNQKSSITSVDRFISAFDGYPTLFSHCVEAREDELLKLKEEGHSIAHCPSSNRLLGCSRLKVERLMELDLPFSLATDGLSSNYSLNIFDELRDALMVHNSIDINILSKSLIDSVTSNAGESLGLEIGKIQEGYFADFTVIKIPQEPVDSERLALWTILHTEEADMVFIEGERYV